MTTSALYSGTLVHARADRHVHRAFRYPVYMAALDLGELGALDRELTLFSHNRTNVFALHDRDYAGAEPDRLQMRRVGAAPTIAKPGGIAGAHAAILAGNGLPIPATTRLVTNLSVLGYSFNPVSFFLGYDAHGRLATVIAEVNNTYGGRFRYVLGPAERLPDRRGRIGFRAVRELFVSPFLHGPVTYDFWFDAELDPETLAIEMLVHDANHHRIFTAQVGGTRRVLTDRALARAAIRYPFMTAQVIGLIHFEAFKLRLAGVPYRRPGPDHRPHP